MAKSKKKKKSIDESWYSGGSEWILENLIEGTFRLIMSTFRGVFKLISEIFNN